MDGEVSDLTELIIKRSLDLHCTIKNSFMCSCKNLDRIISGPQRTKHIDS